MKAYGMAEPCLAAKTLHDQRPDQTAQLQAQGLWGQCRGRPCLVYGTLPQQPQQSQPPPRLPTAPPVCHLAVVKQPVGGTTTLSPHWPVEHISS